MKQPITLIILLLHDHNTLFESTNYTGYIPNLKEIIKLGLIGKYKIMQKEFNLDNQTLILYVERRY